MKKLAAFILLSSFVLAVCTEAFAIGGCSSNPSPTPNPNDNGCAGACSGFRAQCRPACQALNQCCRNNPSNPTGACRTQQQALNDCVSIYPLMSDDAANAPDRIVMSGGVCQLRHSGNGVRVATRSSSNPSMYPVCIYSEYVVVADEYMGISKSSGSQSNQASSKNLRALGITNSEKVQIAQKLAEKFNVTISPRVVRRLRSENDILNCISSAVSTL